MQDRRKQIINKSFIDNVERVAMTNVTQVNTHMHVAQLQTKYFQCAKTCLTPLNVNATEIVN